MGNTESTQRRTDAPSFVSSSSSVPTLEVGLERSASYVPVPGLFPAPSYHLLLLSAFCISVLVVLLGGRLAVEVLDMPRTS